MARSFTLSCQSDFEVWGLQEGEDYSAPIRVLATLFSLSITSAWFSWSKINRLRLFFAHWLSGLVLVLGYLLEELMVTVCWTTQNLEGFIKTVKYIEKVASNMLAITNLAICVNLALVVLSRRTTTRIRSTSHPSMILLILVVSMVISAVTVPFWGMTILLGTAFYLANSDNAKYDFIQISFFYVEFFAGICMFIIVAWLLMFRMTEIKECWKLHRRIRYYFGLTLVGTAVNLGLGICGTIAVSIEDTETTALLLIWSWIFRYVHIALDSVVLNGVLRDTNVDERGGRGASSSFSSGAQPATERPPLSTVPEGSVTARKV